MPLNPAQKQAVEYLSGPLLVLAGPGTGKTQLLSAKVAYILEHTDASPENILCITFTESGARNMRERLLSMIGQAAHQVNIHTYHAFGTHILQKYQHYNPAGIQNLDHPIDTVAQFKIIDQLKSELGAFDLLRSTPTGDILSTIASAKSARLTPADLEAIATRNLADSAAISAQLDPLLKSIVPRMKFAAALPLYQSILSELATFTSADPIIKNIEPLANPLVLDLKTQLDTITGSEKPSISTLTKWKNQHFELGPDGNYRLSYTVACRKLASLAQIYQKYTEILASRGLFDFADMIESAIAALQSDDGFRLTLSEQLQYILLDEFQDTNPSQFELIKLLTAYDQPSVMAVGDDDQAIYAFQGASASNLLDFQSHYNAKIITLTENYRSTAEILDFSRQIAIQISDRFSAAHNINKVLTSFRSANLSSDQPTRISRHEFIDSSAEYAWVASEVNRLLQSGVSGSDISIIAPKHKYIAPLLPFFKPYPHIKISYEKRDNLLTDNALLPLFTLTNFILALASGSAPKHQLLELLSYDFWGLDPAVIVNTLEQNSALTLDLLKNSPDLKLQTLAKFFAHLATLAPTTTLETMLSYFTGLKPLDDFTSPYLVFHTNPQNFPDSTTTADVLHFELLEKLLTLSSAVKDYANHDPATLADLSNFLSDYQLAGESLMNSSPYQNSSDAITIQSAHKSKGLEYDYVFLISADERAWGKGKGNNNLLALPPNLLPIRHTGMTTDEQLRLFFVAITRAKTHLTVTNSLSDFNGKDPARLSYLNESEQNDKVASPFIPAGAVNSHSNNSKDPETQQTLALTWLKNYQPASPEIKDLLRARLKNYTLTASDLLSFIDVIYSGPQLFYKDRLLPHFREPATTAQIYGILLHSAFEKIVNHHFDQSAAIQLYLDELSKLQLPENEHRFLAEKGPVALTLSIDKFSDILFSTNARAEVNLRAENITLDGQSITGVIDLLITDNETKTLTIYDFKTGKPSDAKWLSLGLYRYAFQLTFYKLLLENSTTYSDYTVKSGHILFVNPDSDQLIHDRRYEFDQNTTSTIKNLIKTLPPLITSLDFTLDPEIYLSPDNTRKFSDLEAFIARLLEKYST